MCRDESTPATKWYWVAVGSLIVLTALLALGAMDGGVDDASIVHRYVDRAASGAGLTFNDGERVEGFTSLSWTLLLTAAQYAGLRPVSAGPVLNWLAIVAVGVLLERVLRKESVAPTIRVVTLTIYAVSYPFFAVCYLGLEFGLYAVLLVMFAGAILAWWHDKTGRNGARIWGMLGGLLFATRPDSIVLLPLLGAVCLPDIVRGGVRRAAVFEGLAIWAGITIAVTAWRFTYFDDVLPNSALAKAPKPFDFSPEGLDYVVRAFKTFPLMTYCVALPLVLAGVMQGGRIRRLLPLFLLLPNAYVMLVTKGDWMPHYRFIWVGLPLALVAFAMALDRLRKHGYRLAEILLVVTLALGGLTVYRGAEWRWPPRTVRPEATMATYEVVARSLNPVWNPADTAIPEAIGRFGVAAPNVRIHDHCGLIDRALVHDPAAVRNIYGSINWAYSLSLKPAVIILHFPGHAARWHELAPDFPAGYVFGKMPVPTVPNRPLWILLRRDRAADYRPALDAAGLQEIDAAEFLAAAGA